MHTHTVYFYCCREYHSPKLQSMDIFLWESFLNNRYFKLVTFKSFHRHYSEHYSQALRDLNNTNVDFLLSPF